MLRPLQGRTDQHLVHQALTDRITIHQILILHALILIVKDLAPEVILIQMEEEFSQGVYDEYKIVR